MIRLTRPFLRGAIQALRLHRRVSTLFDLEGQEPFTTFASAPGRFDLFEVGERHELWDTLRGLEFLSLWPPPVVAAPSLPGKTPFRDIRQDDVRPAAAARPASFDASVVRPRTRVQVSGTAIDRSRSRSVAAITPARDERSMPPSIFWRTLIQRVSAPGWPIRAEASRRRRDEPDHRRFTTIQGPAPQDRPESRARSDPPADLELRWPVPAARDSSGLDPEKTDRRAATDPSPSLPRLPRVTSATGTADNTDKRAISKQPDGLDVTWRFLVSQSHGAALGIVERVALEPFFPGLNLGEIRVHTDEPADRAARALRADAFSLGKDIFFRARRFDTSTARGLALVSHELSHTRQILGGEPVQSTSPRQELERDATSMEATVLRAFTSGAVRRDEPRGPAGGAPARYVPLSLEPARASTVAPREHAGVASANQRSLTSAPVSAVATGHAQPLKADEARSAGGAASAASAGDDPEAATRTLWRMLDRKLRMEKERRGVDRWVR